MDILNKEAVPKVCHCQNLSFIAEKPFLNHQVMQHGYWAFYNYLEVWRLNRSFSFTCPGENCQETSNNLNALILHYGSLPHARVRVLQQFDSNNSRWVPIFKMLDRMDSEMLRVKKRSDEMEKEKNLKEQLLEVQKAETEEKLNRLKKDFQNVIKENVDFENKLKSLQEHYDSQDIELKNLHDDHQALDKERETVERTGSQISGVDQRSEQTVD